MSSTITKAPSTTDRISLTGQGLPQLFVNDGPLAADQVALLQPTDPRTTSMDDMRESLKEHGYLFLKGLIPREDVLKARGQYFAYLAETGLLKPGTDAVEGIFDPSKDAENYPGIGTGRKGTTSEQSLRFVELALKAHGESWYKDTFCKNPALLDFVQDFTAWGSNTLGIQRTILRNNVPGNKAIGVHYDLIFLRHGEDSILTAWVPMGDVKVDGGGLIYLEKGHDLGKQIEQDFTARAQSSGMSAEEAKNAFNQNMMSGGVLTDGPREFAEEHGKRWLVADYEAGDVVLHSSYAIHASTVNHDPQGAIRLGTDLRFVDSSAKWDTRWAKVYELGDGL